MIKKVPRFENLKYKIKVQKCTVYTVHMVTYDTVREIALALPNVEESTLSKKGGHTGQNRERR
jgi:hypothetical protein